MDYTNKVSTKSKSQMTCRHLALDRIPPISLLLTPKCSAIFCCDKPFSRILRILGMSDSCNLALRILLPMLDKRTRLLCNSFSLRVQYSRFFKRLSPRIPFKWFTSFPTGLSPTKARSTSEWIGKVLRPIKLVRPIM